MAIVFGVGLAVFSNPSINTPGITRGCSRSNVFLLTPVITIIISFPLNTSPPFLISRLNEKDQF